MPAIGCRYLCGGTLVAEGQHFQGWAFVLPRSDGKSQVITLTSAMKSFVWKLFFGSAAGMGSISAIGCRFLPRNYSFVVQLALARSPLLVAAFLRLLPP